MSVEVSTPRARAFVDAVMAHRDFDPGQWSITSRELRAIVGRHPVRELTRPMVEPAVDVFQDLWQLSHVTPSYVGRALSVFLPFLSVTLALSFGVWSEDVGLAWHAVRALLVSLVCSIAGGAVVAALHGRRCSSMPSRSRS